MKREVVENDLRKDEFKGVNPKDYEFRGDGSIVRKDRWETGIRNIESAITGGCREFEIQNLLDTVKWLMDQIPDRK